MFHASKLNQRRFSSTQLIKDQSFGRGVALQPRSVNWIADSLAKWGAFVTEPKVKVGNLLTHWIIFSLEWICWVNAKFKLGMMEDIFWHLTVKFYYKKGGEWEEEDIYIYIYIYIYIISCLYAFMTLSFISCLTQLGFMVFNWDIGKSYLHHLDKVYRFPKVNRKIFTLNHFLNIFLFVLYWNRITCITT